MQPTLVIFVKEPRPGRAKTRLGQGIGMVASARWFRHQSLSLIHRVSANTRWRTVLAVSPDRDGLQSSVWPNHLPRWPQGRGSLGDRMRRVFQSFPPGPVVIIGADIPGILPAHIKAAFEALGNHEAVFGPADDGGYWLVGLKRLTGTPPGFLRDVRWSSDHALSDTRATLPEGWRVAELGVLRDVDTEADLIELNRRD